MKALSIRQPWAWLIVHGYKNIENRTWFTRVRGIILVHASKQFDKKGYEYVKTRFPHITMPSEKDFQYGGIIGKVEIIGCRRGATDVSPWADSDRISIFLDNPGLLDFHPCRGQLTFFNVDYPGNIQ